MKFKSTSFATDIEILFNDHFTARNVTLDFTNVSATENGEKVVKAGSPINASGVVDNSGDTDVIGILWKNCYESCPVAAIITHGCIDQTKANSASGLTLAVSTWGSDLKTVTWVNAPSV